MSCLVVYIFFKTLRLRYSSSKKCLQPLRMKLVVNDT